MLRVIAIAGIAVVLGGPTQLRAQVAPVRHLVGNGLSHRFHADSAAQVTTATVTLTFGAGDGGPTAPIEFIAQYAGIGLQPSAPPRAVDIIVSENQASDEVPEIDVQVNSIVRSLHARLRSVRSVVATVSFDEFVQMTDAPTIVERAFGAELELSASQIGTLRSIAQRWAGH